MSLFPKKKKWSIPLTRTTANPSTHLKSQGSPEESFGDGTAQVFKVFTISVFKRDKNKERSLTLTEKSS